MVMDAVFFHSHMILMLSVKTQVVMKWIFAKLFVEPAHWAKYKNNDSNYENMLQPRYN
jgi:hypothetical protein